MTIEGGPGWVLDPAPGELAGETLGEDAGPPRTPRWSTPDARRTAVAVLAALAVGAGSATLVADWRTDRLLESDAGALSLEVVSSENVAHYGFGRTQEGRAAMAVQLDVRNTGPRTVALEHVVVEGTGFVAEGVRGRRVQPGEVARLALLRPVRCTDLPDPHREPESASSALVVRAVTEAGQQEQRLPGAVEGWLTGRHLDRQACGETLPSDAVHQLQSREYFRGGAVELHVQLANTSRHDLVLTSAWTAAGLGLQVLDGSGGAPLPMPVRLPGGDFSEPRDPMSGPLEAVALVLRVSVVDCGLLPVSAPPYDGGSPLVELDVASETLSQVTGLGDLYSVLPRLRGPAC